MLHVLWKIGVILLVLAGCSAGANPPTSTTEPVDPQALLLDVVKNIRNVETFRMILTPDGAEWPFVVKLDDSGTSSVEAVLLRGEAQYLSPDIFSGSVRLRVLGLPLTMILFSDGSDQWFRLPTSRWFHATFAEDFNAGALVQEDSGFQKALLELKELIFVENTTLDDGTPVQHLRGTASSESVRELLFGLLEATGDVIIDVFVDPALELPVLLVITQPGTETEEEPEPTQWRLEIFDINADPEIEYPESTPEAPSND